jgi:hypothetical protein
VIDPERTGQARRTQFITLCQSPVTEPLYVLEVCLPIYRVAKSTFANFRAIFCKKIFFFKMTIWKFFMREIVFAHWKIMKKIP